MYIYVLLVLFCARYSYRCFIQNFMFGWWLGVVTEINVSSNYRGTHIML